MEPQGLSPGRRQAEPPHHPLRAPSPQRWVPQLGSWWAFAGGAGGNGLGWGGGDPFGYIQPSPGSGKPNLIPKSPSPDMTFIHEGNRTLAENLINFEKMVSGAGWLPTDPHFRGPAVPPSPGMQIQSIPAALAQTPRQPGSLGGTGQPQPPLKPEGTVFYQPGSKVGPGDSK